MTALRFEVAGAEVVPFALVPTLSFPLRITGDEPVQSIVLRCQIRVEPQQRRYEPPERARLLDVFGQPHRWAETAKPFLWTHVQVPVGPFRDTTEVALPVTCSYDLEVTAGRYFHALDGGAVPLLFLFSGTVFTRGDRGLSASQIPWECEARYQLPVVLWRRLMDAYFPGGAWLRVDRETIDALGAYKSRRALTTWEETLRSLLEEVGLHEGGVGEVHR